MGAVRWTSRIVAGVLFSVELLALFAAWAVVEPRSPTGLLYVAVGLCVIMLGGAQRSRLHLSGLAGAGRLVQDLGVALIIVGFLNASFSFQTRDPFSLAPGLLELAMVSIVIVLASRVISCSVFRAVRRRGWAMEDVIIVGAGTIGCELVRELDKHPEYGLRPLGIVDDVKNCQYALLGGIADIGRLLVETKASHVIVAFSPIREQGLVELVRHSSDAKRTIHFVPRFFEVGQPIAAGGPESIHGIPLVQVRRDAAHTSEWRLKRVIDVVVSLVLIVATLPLMAVLAIAVRLGSPGPALFRQVRVGQKGKEFVLLKFRTLPVGHVDGPLSADAQDYQIPIGRFLRRTSLDELPQLFNILCGEMTLVGPRPERRHLVEQFNLEVAAYQDRHRLPVGLTGLAQVHGLRGDSSIQERARLDNYYIEYWTLWLDFIIISRTLASVIRDLRASILADREGAVISSCPGPEAQGVMPELQPAGTSAFDS